MRGFNLTWTEATNLRQWELKIMVERLEDEQTMKRNRA